VAEVQDHRRWPIVFFATDPKPNADFIFVRLFRVDRADQTQSQQAGGSSACVQI
jgi:hypothetical protein